MQQCNPSEEVNTGLVNQKAAWKETECNLDSESECESGFEEIQAVLKKSKFHSDSSDLSDSETFAEEYGEEGTITSQVHNKELGFLFSKYRTRSGRSIRTSSKVLLWM